VNERLGRIGRAYHGTTSVRHVATLLRDVVGYDAVRASVVRPLTGLKVAIHYGCHLLKPSRIMRVDDPNDPSVMEQLVAALGATPVRHKNWSLCCGKACQSDEIPTAMMRDLLRSVSDEEADLLCLICPTCFGQFDYGQVRISQKFDENFGTPPLYYFQLLAFAGHAVRRARVRPPAAQAGVPKAIRDGVSRQCSIRRRRDQDRARSRSGGPTRSLTDVVRHAAYTTVAAIAGEARAPSRRGGRR
jgi:hypothetical protein